MNNVTHVAIHHDPQGRCDYLLRDYGPKLRELFADGFVVTTKATMENGTTAPLLEKAGLEIIVSNRLREREVETKGTIALVAGYARGEGEIVFSGCLDRTLHWVKTYPEELEGVLKAGLPNGVDFLVIGRTHRALETHPRPQLEVEIETNEMTARLLGINEEIDVATGCRLMSRETAREMVHLLAREHRFSNKGVGIGDSLSPYLVQEGLQRKVGFLRVEGLEFETPDQFREEIAELGYDEWIRRNFNPENVGRREERNRETLETINWWKAELGAKFGFGKETL